MQQPLTRTIYYNLHSGKNNKLLYYLKATIRDYTPWKYFQKQLPELLNTPLTETENNYINTRVDYYNRLTPHTPYNQQQFIQQSTTLQQQPKTRQKVYYHDAMEYARYFPKNKHWILMPGDIDYPATLPSITKSRPIGEQHQCSVLLNMDKIRHFIFVQHDKPYNEKQNTAIFRGLIGQTGNNNNVKKNRYLFMEKFFGNPICNAGVIDEGYGAWTSPKLTINEQLEHKFIMALEGNDVASNLKWIMSSNSIAVMPKPTCETWFMEGTLIPNYHYIEIKPDFSDLEQQLQYYLTHPQEALDIIEHAHQYVQQFKNKKREQLIALRVLQKYFDNTNQQ